MGNEAANAVTSEAMDQVAAVASIDEPNKATKNQLRASQSFDEAVLEPQQMASTLASKASPIYQTASDPESEAAIARKLNEDEAAMHDDFEPELEAIYEPPPQSHLASRPKKQSLTTPSESDEPQYSGQSMIYGRAPSQCSSISATQSFDLRMYGRLPSKAMGQAAAVAASANAANAATGTLKKNEDTRLERERQISELLPFEENLYNIKYVFWPLFRIVLTF